MIRGYALVLSLLVLAVAGLAGWYSTTRVVYFDPDLLREPSGCEWWTEGLPILDEFEVDWFGGELRGFSEPSLHAASIEPPADVERIVRLLWIRSFHDPVVVRIDQRVDDTAILTAKQRPGGAGFDYITSPRSIERPLSAPERAELETLLNETRILERSRRICHFGLDGANWIIEAADENGRYTLVQHWAPQDGPVKEVGEFMLTLTGWDVEPIY
jgi:hypothetical protein